MLKQNTLLHKHMIPNILATINVAIEEINGLITEITLSENHHQLGLEKKNTII